jgi:hypothetical protein
VIQALGRLAKIFFTGCPDIAELLGIAVQAAEAAAMGSDP